MSLTLCDAVAALRRECSCAVLLGSGTDPQIVAQAEDQLRCRFVHEYTEFLVRFGWLQTPSLEFFGVIQQGRRALCTVQSNTIFERERRKIDSVVFGIDGDDLILMLPVKDGRVVDSVCVYELGTSSDCAEHWGNGLSLAEFVLKSIAEHNLIHKVVDGDSN